MFNVHVRVNDAATGQPTPVRLRISDASGRAYPPLGRVAEFLLEKNKDVGGHVLVGGERWYYIDGACEVPLPGGVPLVVEVAKGPEFTPLRHQTTLGAGQMALRLTIQRWVDLRADGWFSGDTRCHFLSPHTALLEAQAEDLAVTQLLATEADVTGKDGNLYRTIANMTAFSGQQPCLERGGHIVAVNTFNTHPVLGSLALLHCHRAVFPLSFGGADATDDWSLADWCDQCHRKKGLVVWSNPFRMELLAPEAFADLVSGRIDAIEVTPNELRPGSWSRAWSAGIRFPLVGASGKVSNRTALGSMRTYAKLPSDAAFNLASWIETVRAGRTFATSGPIIRLTVNDQEVGSIIDVGEPGETVRIRVRVDSRKPLTMPLVVRFSDPAIDSVELGNGSEQASVEQEVVIERPCSIEAYIAGSPQDGMFAQTSPVLVRVGGKLPTSAASRDFAIWLSRTIDWVDTVGRFEIPRRKEQLRAVLEQARQELLSRAGG